MKFVVTSVFVLFFCNLYSQFELKGYFELYEKPRGELFDLVKSKGFFLLLDASNDERLLFVNKNYERVDSTHWGENLVLLECFMNESYCYSIVVTTFKNDLYANSIAFMTMNADKRAVFNEKQLDLAKSQFKKNYTYISKYWYKDFHVFCSKIHEKKGVEKWEVNIFKPK